MAYQIDESHGSEPTTGFYLVEQSLSRFDKTILVTSDTTDNSLLKRLSAKYEKRIDIHVVPVRSIAWSAHPILFYPNYRNWQKDFGRFLKQSGIQFDLGIHASLGTFLFGSGFSMSSQPYIYGPAGFSFFNIHYLKAYGWNSILEIWRNIAVLLLLICDPFVRNSLLKAESVIAGDMLVMNKLRMLHPKIKLIQKPVPHMQIPDFKFEDDILEKIDVDLIWAGRFIPRKDPLFALEVFKEILLLKPEAKLTMIGDGKLRSRVEDFLDKHELLEAVNLTGWVDKNQVMKLMSRANLMIFTSFRETAGVQLFECNNVGTRVVALDATGASSWYENELLEFVSADLFEGRKSLARKFALQALISRDLALLHTIDSDKQASKSYLMDEIFLAIQSDQ